MSAKRLASTSMKQNKSNSWIDALKSININDDNWKCMITMIVETLPEHTIYINLFDEAASKGSRKAIYPITFQKLLHKVKALSKIDPNKCPAAQTVFHHVNNLISGGETLEATLIAGLVKYLVYLAKIDTITRRKKESDLENDADREIRAMLNVAKVESQRSMQSVKSKKSGQSTEVPMIEKTNTHLRKQGEEWSDKVYIDDAPVDGPDLFILLTGFRDPGLPLELIKAGLPLTCILKIRSGESLDSIESSESIVADDTEIMQKTLFNFWSMLEKSTNSVENLDYYSGVIFQTFCPPAIELNRVDDEEGLKKDLYDRVSWIVYDLYDLQRLHVDYIRNIKLQRVPKEPRQNFELYTKIMDSIPAECAFVTVILQAMLTQVESDLQRNQESDIDDEELRSSRDRVSADGINKSKFDVNSTYQKSVGHPSHVGNLMLDGPKHYRQRIQEFNLQYGRKPRDPREVGQMENPEIILANDRLRLQMYHVRLEDDVVEVIKPRVTSLSDIAVRSLLDTRIQRLWRNYNNIPDATKKTYRCHLNKITRCFGDRIDFRRLVHYLHLQVFDKMINGGLNRTATRGEDRRVAITEKGAIPAATHSDPFLLSSKILQDDRTFASGENPISNLRCSKSDSIIDYDKSVGATFECPELFYLTDTREILQPGFLATREENLCETRMKKSVEVAEFTDVRLLSSDIFLQEISECLEKFEGFQFEYLETTDSILLQFGHVPGSLALPTSEEHKVFRYGHRYHRVLRIVTPVCFRNFSEYIIHEEDAWIREVESDRARKRSMSAGELTRKMSHHSDIDVMKITTFTDDDFILPNSLKGQTRKKDADKLSIAADSTSMKSVKSAPKSEKGEKIPKGKPAISKSSNGRSKKELKSVEIDENSSTVNKVPSLRCARDDEPYKFIGYDLGNRRIQITSESETFVSADGTTIKVDLDQWLYGEKHLGISINCANCYLKLESIVGFQNNDRMPFHLITENGIVLAFCKAQESEDKDHVSAIRFDFRASWPSGLLVETVTGDSLENPFCILQKYISKGPECGLVLRENYRKFLRNGTVLKFYVDGQVEVLRPNGTIVRCVNFEKTTRARNSELDRDENLSKEDTSKSKKSRSTVSTKGKRKTSSPKKRDLRTTSLDHINGETDASREQAGRVKITRYTTVQYDGQYYETVNDEVSRMFDKSLVRTITDFEVGEKFSRREDGTQWLLNSNGDLIVSYPDGTSITSGFTIEDEPLICDWNNDEFNRFYKNSCEPKPNGAAILSQFSNVSWTGSNRSLTRRSTTREDRMRILLADAFVSVLMTCRMEHECYATVVYDQAKKSCELSMPDEVVIGISNEGTFNLNIGPNLELRIREDNLKLLSRFSEDDQNNSKTVYNLLQPKIHDENSSRDLLVTTDSLGNIFTVHEDGTVILDSDSAISPSISRRTQGRLFAMNRDLTAYEYLHKSQRNKFQERINFDVSSSVISIPNGRAPGLEYRLFLNPPEPTNYSKMWLQKVTKVRQTNHDRTDLSRSTYSNPYEWIYPFGRDGNGVSKNTSKVPLAESFDESRPRVLTLTLFQGIAIEGKNLLIELQKALASYWHSKITGKGISSTCSLLLEDPSTSSQMKVDKKLMDLALGTERNIDINKYVSGVQKDQILVASNEFCEVPVCSKFREQNTLTRAEIQWYSACLREQIILPYFENIQGFCFLRVISCVDKALEKAEK